MGYFMLRTANGTDEPRGAERMAKRIESWQIVIGLLWGLSLAAVVMLLLQSRVAQQRGLGPQQGGNNAIVAPTVTQRGELHADEQHIIELFRAASPSTVYITSNRRVVNPFARQVTEVPRGAGSGFIWDEHGHIVTNYHVIQNATSADVVLHDHSTHRAELVGVSPNHDLAVLRIKVDNGTRLQPLPLGTSHDLQVGQKVLAIGNPFGLDQTLTTGVVSSLNRRIMGVGGRPIEDVIQTDAAINPGNSGGPLLDSAGRLIGINTAILSPSGAYAGLGFAVPVDTVVRVVPQLIAHGEYTQPTLGVGINDAFSQRILARVGAQGVLVLSVEEGSPAARAGLRATTVAPDGSVSVGDIIQKIDDRQVKNAFDLLNALDHYQTGDTITLTYLRNGKTQTVQIKLE